MKQVIPVVVINDEKETIEILSKLREGGINCAEITFRTACAKEAIAIGTKAFEDMNIGAGTVINAEQAKSAVQAGAMVYFMITTFLDLILRVVLAFILVHPFGITGIWLSWPFGWVISSTLSLAFYLFGVWDPLKKKA